MTDAEMLSYLLPPMPPGSGADILRCFAASEGWRVDRIMGSGGKFSHGRSGLARFALGSVAERLVRHGTAPVLLVHAFGPPITLQHAVVPLDGSAPAEAALRVVKGLAPDVVREVTLVRVIEGPEQRAEAERYLAEAAQQLQVDHLACRQQVERGNVAQVILDVAGPDKLVVMATHGRSGLTRWALGSVADRVAHGGVGAVLLVRAGATNIPRAQ